MNAMVHQLIFCTPLIVSVSGYIKTHDIDVNSRLTSTIIPWCQELIYQRSFSIIYNNY